MSVRTVGVAVEQAAYHFDKLYTYRVPDDWPTPLVGCRVAVPFGGGNTLRAGFVLAESETEAADGLKCAAHLLDDTPVLGEEMVKLAAFLKEHTFCTRYDACKTMLPAGIHMQITVRYTAADGVTEEALAASGLPAAYCAAVRRMAQDATPRSKEQIAAQFGLPEEAADKLARKKLLTVERAPARRMGDATVKTVRLTEAAAQPPAKLTPKQKLVLDLLATVGEATVKEICYFTGVTPAVIHALQKKDLVALADEAVFRIPEPAGPVGPPADITLSPVQQAAFDRLHALLQAPAPAAALLYGVTGSGKTSVYLKLIDAARERQPDAGVIVMVPEIALTPQAVAIFKGRYGDRVAIFHSRLSLGERMDEWKRVKSGQAAIAVGTRSAVFAPFAKLSLIVMDEEQEHTYKSESSPRYHARDVARFRAAHHGALLVLSSATPALESFAKARAGAYTLCRMDQRYGPAVLPEVKLIDMRDELARGNASVVSGQLLTLLDDVLAHRQQAILLHNRRGYHTFVSCSQCGRVMECPDCSISMTYHRDNGRLMCHYCGYSAPMPTACPQCGGDMIKMSGIGTQKAEEQLARLLPGARILRMDADSTMSRTAHGEKLEAFARGDYDILLGTQMVAKGLDFPNVTLVGVLNADQMLHHSDYRACERGFALLTQVIGRAGRSQSPGLAVIQTSQPDHELIEMARRQDYDAFYEQEIALRRLMQYPPFCDLCMVGFTGADHAKTRAAALAMLDHVKQLVAEQYASVPLKILGPSPARVVRVGGRYRYRMLIKCRNTAAFRALLHQALCRLGQQKGMAGVSVFADMNPEGIL